MSLFIMRVTTNPKGSTDWYFDDEYQFKLAEMYAMNRKVWVSSRSDYITDFDEFVRALEEP